MLPLIELFIDEDDNKNGVFAISLVEEPAIESNFIALNKGNKVEMRVMNEEKRIAIGMILIPEKRIYRRRNEYEYEVMFSKETVKKASELYLKLAYQHNTTYEHKVMVDGVYLSESWIIEDPERDKTAVYGIDGVAGAWAGVMKIENEDVWQRVKKGEVLGFSIEGIFDEKNVERDPEAELRTKIEEIKKILGV